MAQNRWQGNTGVYITTGNWSLGTLPAATEDVVIPADVTQGITSGAGGQNAITTNSIGVERGHIADIATSGAPWQISTNTLVHEGNAQLFFMAGDAKIGETVINAVPTTAGAKSASLTGAAAAAAYGTITVVRGIVDVEGVTFTIDRMEVGYVGSQSSDATVLLKPANGLVSQMIVYGGNVTLGRPVTDLIVCGGRVVIDDFDPVTVHQSGGTVEYRNGGTITEYTLGAGTLDLTTSTKEKTITTLRLVGSPSAANYLTDRYTTFTNPPNLTDYRIAG